MAALDQSIIEHVGIYLTAISLAQRSRVASKQFFRGVHT